MSGADISAFTIRAYVCLDPIEPRLNWVAHCWAQRHGFQKKGTVRDMLPATAFGETEDAAISALSAVLAEGVRKEEARQAAADARAETMRRNNPNRSATSADT
jgi:hypothetical protein